MGQVSWTRVAFISILLASLAFPLSPAGRTAYHQPKVEDAPVAIASQSLPPLVAEYHGFIANSAKSDGNLDPGISGGIREQIPEKYAARYQRWKQEFLATETGRLQWASYQNNPNFTLTLVISRDNPEGGNTGSYEWNAEGKLVAATITLGCRLDEGVPNPIYFPVMNSLFASEATRKIGGETLAATKIAHEFGHVNRTAKGDPVLYQLQSQLMPQYNQILLSNGRDAQDPQLLELARRMGATPVEIWEDREYWGETNAMLYLRDRFAEDGFRCLLFSRIKRSIELYARGYEERFLNIAQSLPSDRRCGW
jgi:YD repeat-containing protein